MVLGQGQISPSTSTGKKALLSYVHLPVRVPETQELYSCQGNIVTGDCSIFEGLSQVVSELRG